jgi:uncharacterized protein (DUF427 family)
MRVAMSRPMRRSDLVLVFAAVAALGSIGLAYWAWRRSGARSGGRSPGHRRWPGHKVAEHRISERVQVDAGGAVIADSNEVIRVDEDGQPARFYFPRSHVRTDWLTASATTTHCPFKGIARYYHLNLNGVQLRDAAWSYEQPYEEHRALKDRLAFHEDRMQEVFLPA